MGIIKNCRASILLFIMVIMGLFLCCDSRVQAAQEEYYIYTATAGNATITKYVGKGGDVTIPGTLGGLTVTGIGESAFWDCDRLTSITIPQGVTCIGAYAFFSCEGLTRISIPQGITSIGEYAFSGCSGLTSINIPSEVIGISSNAFADCSNLSAITVAEDNLTYTSKDGVLFNKAGDTLIACPGGLTNIVIPQEVTSIGKYAFYGCRGLTSIAIPQGVTDIGEYAFYSCERLTGITIPSGVTSIAGYAFSHTGLTSITIPPGVTSIGDNAFFACKGLTSITIPEGVVSIGEHAFSSCQGLSSFTIPSGVTSIGKGTFSFCTGLTSITIPAGVTIIGNYAFTECSRLTSITIPEAVISIGRSAFNGCSGLTSITFNSATTTIDDTEYTIPVSTKIIGYDPSTAKDYAAKYGRDFDPIGGSSETWTDWKVTLQKGSKEYLTITFNKEVDADSLIGNIYVAGDVEGSDKVNGIKVQQVTGNACQVKVVPPGNGWQSGTYYLFINRQVKARGVGKSLNSGIRMKFNVTP